MRRRRGKRVCPPSTRMEEARESVQAILKPKDQMVTAYPDITVEKIQSDCEFIIIACDGIWDCMSS